MAGSIPKSIQAPARADHGLAAFITVALLMRWPYQFVSDRKQLVENCAPRQ